VRFTASLKALHHAQRTILETVETDVLVAELKGRRVSPQVAAPTEDLIAELSQRGYDCSLRRTLIELPNLAVDSAHRYCRAGGKLIPLDGRECAVLALLAGAWPKPMTTDTILLRVWGRNYSSQNVTVVTRRLRRKIGNGAIVGQQGVGYWLDLEALVAPARERVA
jgi:DNA-binding response OmpR family regulator